MWVNNNGFNLKYKVVNYSGRNIVLKNRLGFNTTIKADEVNGRYVENNSVYLEFEIVVNDMFNVTFNNNCLSNEIDKSLMEVFRERIEEEKKKIINVNLNNHYGVTITGRIRISRIKCNYKNNGYQSDALGFTLEFEDDCNPTFYKEDLEGEILTEIIPEEMKSDKERIYSTVKLIDNENRVGDLWTVIYGKSINIKRTIANEEQGLYIYLGPNLRLYTFIPMSELTEEKLKEYGLFKTELEAYKEPHNKHFIELIKEKDNVRKKLKDSENKVIDLEDKLYESKRKRDREVDKLEETINIQKSEIEKMKNTGRMLEVIRKMFDDLNKRETTKEIEKIKENNKTNDILDFIKGFVSVASAIVGLVKIVT